MPRGVYPRTQNQLRAAKVNLAKGREPAARAKAQAKLAQLGADPVWRRTVAKATRKAMRDPIIRAKHLLAMRGQTSNFKGGNGQQPTLLARQMEALLGPSFTPELVIKTAGHATRYKPPNHYKVDFGNPTNKLAIELDGPSHRPHARQAKDRKKNAVLKALGWTVLRLRHE